MFELPNPMTEKQILPISGFLACQILPNNARHCHLLQILDIVRYCRILPVWSRSGQDTGFQSYAGSAAFLEVLKKNISNAILNAMRSLIQHFTKIAPVSYFGWNLSPLRWPHWTPDGQNLPGSLRWLLQRKNWTWLKYGVWLKYWVLLKFWSEATSELSATSFFSVFLIARMSLPSQKGSRPPDTSM